MPILQASIIIVILMSLFVAIKPPKFICIFQGTCSVSSPATNAGYVYKYQLMLSNSCILQVPASHSTTKGTARKSVLIKT